MLPAWHQQPQTIIAVGQHPISGTYPRGSSCELLQSQGRYLRQPVANGSLALGFRPGYQDLPASGLPKSLRRTSVSCAHRAGHASRDPPIRNRAHDAIPNWGEIRSHPDMAITAANKSHFTEQVTFSYGGHRFQTFIFTHDPTKKMSNFNLSAACQLITEGIEFSPTHQRTLSRVGGYYETYRSQRSSSSLASTRFMRIIVLFAEISS